MNSYRKQEAFKTRVTAAELAAGRPHPRHIANGDEQKFRTPGAGSKPSYLASFTKGMPHDAHTGLVLDPKDFQQFVKGIDSGDPRDFKDTRLGPVDNGPWHSEKAEIEDPEVRAWESQGAGSVYDLEGPDAQAVTMPPAPAMGSDELIAEISEIYAQALLRDVPFTGIVDGSGAVYFDCSCDGKPDTSVNTVLDALNKLAWFKSDDCCDLTSAQAARKRKPLTYQTAFRGITHGDDIGPYVSQFLLAGTGGINGNDVERTPAQGLISYGAMSIDQRVRFPLPCDDHMTNWYEWLDVQEGADFRKLEQYVHDPKRRFITTPRDLTAFVHYDALYEAYLNACLILIAIDIPFDPDIPFQGKDADDHQQGFAHFGGPHILSLLTEVATRALKAVRFQKFNVHRRLRPEALAARLSRHDILQVPEIGRMVAAPGLKDILEIIVRKNGSTDPVLGNSNYLLPMAFCEGSPMHPSYGAGHATVAGACVTILKAFFDHRHPLAIAIPEGGTAVDAGTAYVAVYDESKAGDEISSLQPVPVLDKDGNPAILTVEGELNKLASNISIARNWAGVHYFSDYIESLRMGEQIAIGILEEQKLTYGENFSMTVPLFDGGSIRI